MNVLRTSGEGDAGKLEEVGLDISLLLLLAQVTSRFLSNSSVVQVDENSTTVSRIRPPDNIFMNEISKITVDEMRGRVAKPAARQASPSAAHAPRIRRHSLRHHGIARAVAAGIASCLGRNACVRMSNSGSPVSSGEWCGHTWFFNNSMRGLRVMVPLLPS